MRQRTMSIVLVAGLAGGFAVSGCKPAAPAPEAGTKIVEGNPHKGYCPVQGEAVDMAKASADAGLYTDYKGKRYYYCCPKCKPKFEQDPEKWIAKPAEPKKEEGAEHEHASS